MFLCGISFDVDQRINWNNRQQLSDAARAANEVRIGTEAVPMTGLFLTDYNFNHISGENMVENVEMGEGEATAIAAGSGASSDTHTMSSSSDNFDNSTIHDSDSEGDS